MTESEFVELSQGNMNVSECPEAEDSCMSESTLLSFCEELFIDEDANSKRDDLERSCAESQVLYDSDPFQFSGYLSELEFSEDFVCDESNDTHKQDANEYSSSTGGSPEAYEREHCNDLVYSGFVTGSNKRLKVERKSIHSAYKAFGANLVDSSGMNVTPRVSDVGSLERIYARIKQKFVKEHECWVYSQFKWSWLHLTLGEIRLSEDLLVDGIEKQMKLRKRKEYSVLRRIVEGDDVPWRYMVLLVIGIVGECIEVFDGSYSLYACYDETIGRKIRKREIRVGCKLRVFGASLLLSKATSIFDVDGVPLRLCGNGVQVLYSVRKLGYKRKVGFRSRISEVMKEGGVVSCIQGVVVKIIETKYLVRVENYSHVTDDLETELSRIEELARDAHRVFTSDDLKIKMFVKFMVRDESGECVITWWNPSDDVRVGANVRMIYLDPVPKSKEIHLTTSTKTSVRFLS